MKRYRHPFRRAEIQAALLIALWFACDQLARGLQLPLPGGVIGLLLVLLALQAGWVRPRWLSRGADLLIRHILLFLIPAVPVVLDHPDWLGLLGVKLLLILVIGTALVMAATAGIVRLCLATIDREPPR